MTPFSVFALLFVLCGIGRVLVWRRMVPLDAAATVNTLALSVCLPASIALHAPKLVLDRSLLGLIAIPWLLLGLTIALAFFAARVLRFDRGAVACVLLLAPLGNTSFLGYSLCPALAGEGSLKYAVAYDQFGSFVILSTFGLVAIAISSGKERPTARMVLRRILTFPPFVALVFALTIVPARLPAPLEAALSLVADALLPLVSLGLGMQLKLRLPRRELAPLGFTLVLKLVVLPALALGLCRVFGLAGEMRAAAVLESAMPTMITAAALLAVAGIAPELAAAIVGYGTLASVVTLPLWSTLL